MSFGCHGHPPSRSRSVLACRLLGGSRAGVVFLPRQQKQQSDPGADGAVGDVEGWKANFAAATSVEIEVDEVHNMPLLETSNQLAGDPAEVRPQRGLPKRRGRYKVWRVRKQNKQR